MKNIERFNLYAAYVLGKLYDQFPVARAIDTKDVIEALKLPPQKPDPKQNAESMEHAFVTHTLQWLVDTGYLIMRESGTHVKRYVLSPKAFEALSATLSALEGKKSEAKEKSVGEVLSDAATGAGKEMAKETWKQVSSQIVGQVIGHAVKVISGPG
ncbi:hypothetical protein [Hyphomicrobium sp. NDB2Meth4]|uniref:hypothetical protein n=1 Tax=Hyphomicrobium sp. NDB2Meth4 TaxID=1892846 RepID=UPI0009308ADE|nr:hypothetical protein [Hyphomicrobium sp. NDB2Meth4]